MLERQRLFRLSRHALVAFAIVGFSSCATIINGGDPLVTIEGDIKEPVTIITDAKTYKDVTLPIEVKVERHGISGQQIQIFSDSLEFEDVVLQKKVTGWTAANYLMLNIPGFFIDWATNCNVKPRHTHYLISPKGERKVLRSTEPFHEQIPVNRPHAGEFYRHELSLNLGISGVLEDEFYDHTDRHVNNYDFCDNTCLDSQLGYYPLSLDYLYNINRRLAVGLTLGKGTISETKEKWVEMPVDDEEAIPTIYCYDARPESRGFHVMPSVRYKWWIVRNAPLAFYSQLSLGYARTKFTVNEVRDESGTVLLPSYSTSRSHLGYQATFAGMEIGRGHLRSFLEVGMGYKGIVNTGLKYCF